MKYEVRGTGSLQTLELLGYTVSALWLVNAGLSQMYDKISGIKVTCGMYPTSMWNRLSPGLRLSKNKHTNNNSLDTVQVFVKKQTRA